MMRHQPSKRTFTWGRALALLPLPILALLGCGTLIGLDSYTVGGAGSGGAGGTVSSGGSSGSSGGKGGAGHGGSGGTGVAGATEGGGGPANQNVGCDGVTTFAPNESVIRSCLLRAGCGPNITPVRTISECVSRNTQAALPGESCNLASRTCADYEACEHVGIAHDDLCGGTKTTRCENGIAINCGNYAVDQFYDCKSQGFTCGTYTFADNSLLYADCEVAVTPATSCAGLSDDQSFYCQAGSGKPDAYYYCYGGQAYGASCGQFASCYDTTPTTGAAGAGNEAGASGTGTEHSATCYFNFNATCTGADSATCASGVAKLCSGGDVINYDCGSVGLDCAVKGTDGYCVAPGCKPLTVDNCAESCGDDGITLNFCYGGVPHSVDCTAYGFTTCTPGTFTDSSGTDTPFAACR